MNIVYKKILSLDWNIASNDFIFYFTDIINTASNFKKGGLTEY